MGLIPWRRKKKPPVAAAAAVQAPADSPPLPLPVPLPLPRDVDDDDDELDAAQTRPRSTTSLSMASTLTTESGMARRRRSIGDVLNFKRRRSSRLCLVATQAADPGACPLLAWLPYEIRESIYLNLVRDEGNWTVPVREPVEGKSQRKELERARLGREPRACNDELASFVRMMLTCRAVNTEMLALLHQKVHLHMPSLAALTDFLIARKLPPSVQARRQTVRSITLAVTLRYLLYDDTFGGPLPDPENPDKFIHYDTKGWATATEGLRRLRGLRFLRIELRANDFSHLHPTWPSRPSAALQESLFEPLAAIGPLEHYCVTVSWPLDWDFEAKGYPFQLGNVDGAEGPRRGLITVGNSTADGVFRPHIPTNYGHLGVAVGI